MDLEVVNIVATVKLSSRLDLQQLANNLENAESSSSKWLKMRLPPENYYIAFYKSGKFLVTGARSPKVVNEIAERVLQILRTSGFDPSCEGITIHNVVMVGCVKLNVSLEKIICVLDNSKASYEPEQFPGLMYKGFGVTFLLFPSGKMVITGAKEIISGRDAAKKFKQIVEEIY